MCPALPRQSQVEREEGSVFNLGVQDAQVVCTGPPGGLSNLSKLRGSLPGQDDPSWVPLPLWVFIWEPRTVPLGLSFLSPGLLKSGALSVGHHA